MDIPAFTIASNNYLAFASVLANSYREHHPEAPFYACIVDRPDPRIDYGALPFQCIFAQDLGIEGFSNLAFRYEILELNTALKPFVFSHLRERLGHDRAFYFDPDVLVCDALEELASKLDSHSILLTPHLTSPLTDQRAPSELAILRSGVYNLGFLGLRLDSSTTSFLDWWQEHLRRHCIVDPPSGLFVDQAWMGLAPSLFDSVAIVREPVYNLAYWNLANRSIDATASRWTVAGRRIGFMHFSGIDLDNLAIVSRHQDRLHLDDRPDLRPCFETYRRLVVAADHEVYRKIDYAYAKFSDGNDEIPSTARTLLARVDPEGRRWRNPFDATHDDSFRDWLLEPLPFASGTLSRLALGLWEERPDLRQAFPGVDSDHLAAFAAWIREEVACRRLPGIFEAGVSADLRDGHSSVRTLENLLTLVHLGQPAGLSEWLNQPMDRPGHGARITRLAMMIHHVRPDLHEVFPDPLGHDRASFATWFVTCGRMDYRLPKEVISPVVDSLPPGAITTTRSFAAAKAAHHIKDLEGGRKPEGWSEWLNADLTPAGTASPRITRLAMTFYDLLPELHQGLADPLAAHAGDLATWFVTRGRSDYHLPDSLLEQVQSSLSRGSGEPLPRLPGASTATGTSATTAARHPRSSPPGAGIAGVNLAGYFRPPTGVGQMGRSSLATLEHLNVPLARIALDCTLAERTYRNVIHHPEGAPYSVTLLNANADETPWALSTLPRATLSSSWKIGYWYWELADFPLAFADRFSLLDEIWAPSTFCRDAYLALSGIPVTLVPPYVAPPTVVVPERTRFGLRDEQFVFFFAFDAGSVPERKNPLGAIEALRLLQSASGRPCALLLKVGRPTLAPGLIPRLQSAAAGLPVTIVAEGSSRSGVDTMLASSDAILSLHRSEGLGLLPIEGLYLEKPVVATHYGGVTDYLDDTTGFPVRYSLKSLEEDHPPYSKGCSWAEPDLGHAVEQMLRVLREPEQALQRAREGRRRVTAIYGLDAAARRTGRELGRIFSEQRTRREVEGQEPVEAAATLASTKNSGLDQAAPPSSWTTRT